MSSVNSDDEQQQRWVPTHIQVTVLRARGLRGKGKNGTSDVYTIIQVGKEKYSTCVVERSTSPEWKEECSFELLPGVLEEGGRGAYPPGSCDLVLTVMHRALIGLDVFLGQAVIPLDKAFEDHVYATNEAEWVNLRSRWFRLNSKTGKKEKERGEVQATVQFTRNNLTASMYHLAMKDKSHSAFSKLKERMRGKKRSSVDEDAPAAAPPSGGSLPRARTRLPSDGGGEEEYEDDEGGEGRRNKMRTFFLRGKLRKSSETRSSTSLGSESSESSSRGGSLSPTAGISVVVSDLSNSPSTSSNLTADNSPEHTADISPKLSPDHSEFGDECGEISIAVPSLYHNGVHPAQRHPPLRPGPGDPAAPPAVAPAAPTTAAPAKASGLGLGLLLKPLPTSLSLQNLSPREEEPPRAAGGAGDGRRWSFDKPGEEEKAAIAAALEKSGPMVGDEEEEEEEEAPAVGAARESYDRKQQQQQKKKKVSGGRAGSEPAQERTGKGWFGSKDGNNKPSPVVSAKLGCIPESPRPPPPLLPLSRHPSWGPGSPPAPPSPPPPILRSPLHHTNPFWQSRRGPPPHMSPRNPFFSSPEHHPAPAVALSGQPLTPQPPPLPHLSSSRPPIAQLLSPVAPGGQALSASDATGGAGALAKPRHRPLPPFPAERPLSRRSPNPFVSSRTSELDVDWDDSFEAFASCRLQSAEDTSAGSKPQEPQKGPAQTSPKSQHLALWHPDEEQQLKTTEATKDPGCSDTFPEPFLAAVPATNQQAGMLLTAPPEDPHTNLANYSSDVLTCTTPPLDLCHHCQCAHSPSISCDVEEMKNSRYSSDPSSSGVGSLAEEDVLSIVSSCSASKKMSACVGADVEAKCVHGSPLNVCEESPEQTVVGVLGESEEKLCDWLGPLVVDHTVEGNLIQVSDQNENPQSVILMDGDDQWLVSLPVVSLVEIQCGVGPSKVSCPTHVPRSDLPLNNPNTSVPSDQEEETSACKTEKMEEACELQESFGDLHKPDNISVQATNVVEETFTPDILDSRGTSLCPSFHTVTSFLGDESSLLETPLGAGAPGEQLIHQSSPTSPAPLWSSQMMAAPILVFNESSLMETPLGVRHSSPEPSELLDVDASQTLTVPAFHGALPGETWAGPGPGGLLSSLYGSTDSQHYQTCLTHNSSAATTVSVDSLVEPPSEHLVLSPENTSALGLEGSADGRGPWDASQEPGAEWLPSEEVLFPEDFGFHSVVSRHHGDEGGPAGGAQGSEGPPSEETSPARAVTPCPALQRSQGALGTGSSGHSLTSYGSHPSVVHPLPPNDPAEPPLPSLSPTSCLPAEAPSARYALPNALLPPPPGPAPQAPPPAPRAATPVRDEAAAPPEAPQEEGLQDSPHPVRPLTPGGPQGSEGRSVLEKLRSTMQPGRSSQLSEGPPERRKSLTEGAGSYFHLTHNELVALLVRREAELERQKAEFERQTALLSRREVELRKLKPQVRDLENYIDTLLVQIMEQTPTLLQVRSKFK